MKGLIYTRVSTNEQVGGTSLSSQLEQCRQFARKANVDVLEECIFSDEGESAKVTARPALQDMLTYVRQHKSELNFLYIWKIDRLSRNLGDYLGLKVALDRYGVKIVSVTEPIDDDPVGRFLESILAAAAQFDNEIRAIRSLGGMKARVEQGHWPHSAPLGYMKKNKKVVQEPQFAPIVTELLTRFSTGQYKIVDIQNMAFDKGIMTKAGKPRPSDSIKNMLKNYFYAGRTLNKLSSKVNKGAHKPLVTIDIIDKNLEILEGTKRNYSLYETEVYPLKNILLCETCLKNMTASAPTGRNKVMSYPSYHCNRKTCTKKVTGKPQVSTNIDMVHKAFRALLEAFRPLDEGIANLYKSILVKSWNEHYKNSINALAKVEKEIERNRTLQVATNRKFIEDKITEADRDSQFSLIKEDLLLLEEERVELAKYVEENQNIVEKAMDFINTPDIFWNRSSSSVKKMIQLFMFPDGIVYGHGTGFGTTEQRASYLLLKKIADKSAINSDLVAATGIEPVTSGL